MYSRFLKEAAEAGLMFREPESNPGIAEKIRAASLIFEEIEMLDEDAYAILDTNS